MVADIGKSLGVGAYMSNLRLTKIGSYSINDAVKPRLNTESIKAILSDKIIKIVTILLSNEAK
ncbi:MAG: hypothetical protein R3B12_00550 [Candidatus Saccharimonadales bacterium]